LGEDWRHELVFADWKRCFPLHFRGLPLLLSFFPRQGSQLIYQAISFQREILEHLLALGILRVELHCETRLLHCQLPLKDNYHVIKVLVFLDYHLPLIYYLQFGVSEYALQEVHSLDITHFLQELTALHKFEQGLVFGWRSALMWLLQDNPALIHKTEIFLVPQPICIDLEAAPALAGVTASQERLHIFVRLILLQCCLNREQVLCL
jgi:hypothetical protein